MSLWREESSWSMAPCILVRATSCKTRPSEEVSEKHPLWITACAGVSFSRRLMCRCRWIWYVLRSEADKICRASFLLSCHLRPKEKQRRESEAAVGSLWDTGSVTKAWGRVFASTLRKCQITGLGWGEDRTVWKSATSGWITCYGFGWIFHAADHSCVARVVLKISVQ